MPPAVAPLCIPPCMVLLWDIPPDMVELPCVDPVGSALAAPASAIAPVMAAAAIAIFIAFIAFMMVSSRFGPDAPKFGRGANPITLGLRKGRNIGANDCSPKPSWREFDRKVP